MLAEVMFRARPAGGAPGNEIIDISPRGLVHRFRIQRAGGVDTYVYRLEAVHGQYARTTGWLPAPNWADATDGTLRFAVASDVQKTSLTWPAISRAIVAEQPNLLVFTGDMVWDGRHDWEWDEQFLGPARQLLGRTPLYFVVGNHEQEAPIISELLTTPAPDGRSWNWSQQIGDVLLIGILGDKHFNPGTDNHAWLTRTLAGSNAKFIFLFGHYPAWSSIHNADVDEAGEPYDWVTHQGQTVLMPLLAKHNATAFVTGHDHFYERSEPPGGVTEITCGGGGGTLESRDESWPHHNPHSKVFASQHHYLLFDVNGNTCTMTAVALNGEIIDTRTWQARSRPAAAP